MKRLLKVVVKAAASVLLLGQGFASAQQIINPPSTGGGSSTITGVSSGTGLNGGGTSGNVTLNLNTPVSPSLGGTGVNNGTNTLTLGGPLATSGTSSLTLTTNAPTNVTLPTTGTLSTLIIGTITGTARDAALAITAETNALSRTATGSVVSRTNAAAAADVFNVKDYGALGTSSATTIGTTYGSSLSAVAAYTTAAGATPFSWMTNSAYGLTFSLSTSAAQGSAGTGLQFSTTLTGINGWSNTVPQFNGFWPANQQYLVLPGMTVSGSCVQAGTTVASTAAADNSAKLTSAAQGSAGTTLTFLDTTGLVVGQTVTAASGIPANTTIASLTSTTVTLSASTTSAIAAQTAIQFSYLANVTLSQATSSACAASTAITFTLSNSQVQALTADYVGLQSAFAAAASNNGGRVLAPAGVYEINRPVWNTGITNTNAYTPAIVFKGAGMYTTEIVPTSDFGSGACAMGESNRGPSSTGYAEWDDFRILGPGTPNTSGAAVASMDGLCISAKARVWHVSSWLFNAGLNILNDHQLIRDSDFGNNFYGIYWAPNGAVIGNQRVYGTPTVGNAKAAIAVAWNNGINAATLSDSDTGGDSPYAFYEEAFPYNQTSYPTGFIGYSVIQNMLAETTGNGYIYSESGGTVNNNTFVGGQPVISMTSNTAFKLPGVTPKAVVYTAYFLNNNLVNADFSNGGANFALVSQGIFNAEIQNNSFGDQTPMLTNLSATIPALNCNAFGFSNGSCAWNSFYLGQASGEFRPLEAAVTTGQVLMYGVSYAAAGTRPMAQGGQPLGVALVTSAAGTQVPVVERGYMNAVSKVTGNAVTTGQALCVSASTPTAVNLCSSSDGAGQYTIGSAVETVASGATSLWVDLQIVSNGVSQGFTVTTLPTCNSVTKALPGFYVTDATAPTYNGTLTGSGTVTIPVWCDGSNWHSH